MKRRATGRFSLREREVTERGFTYQTFLLRGWLNGVRIRKQFKSRDEALGEKNRLEVLAANSGEITARNTRLSAEQLAEAEAAFAALGGRSLTMAVEWFRANYRPPIAEKLLSDATKAFLADRAQHVRAVVTRNYRHTMTALEGRFPRKHVHEITTADVEAFLGARKIGKKRFNNLRGELHTFFAYCQGPTRSWTRENPVAAVPWFKLTRGLPEILTAKRAAEIMAYVQTYAGGPRSKLQPGCLVPYFALCLFAGLRPSVKNGEIAKLAAAPDIARFIDFELGVIRLAPDHSKVKGVRQVKIRPNLAAWLKAYPIAGSVLHVQHSGSVARATDAGGGGVIVHTLSILPRNARRMINHVRHKFGIGADVMRHTFISMHVAKWKSVGEAALEAGNSEAMIKKHYLNMVTEAEAAEFWGIGPSR